MYDYNDAITSDEAYYELVKMKCQFLNQLKLSYFAHYYRIDG